MEPVKALHHSWEWVFKLCDATTQRGRTFVEAWPGICTFGSPHSTVTWMKGEVTKYDGSGDQGGLYTPAHLVADLKAGDLVVSAIRCNRLLTSGDPRMNAVLKHVFAAAHGPSTKQVWLEWMMQRLAPVTLQPEVNARGKPKLKHRGKAKPKCACHRDEFAATLKLRHTSKDVTTLFREHKQQMHK